MALCQEKALNLTEFWDNLVQGKNAIREVPLSRWNPSDYYNPDPAGYVKYFIIFPQIHFHQEYPCCFIMILLIYKHASTLYAIINLLDTIRNHAPLSIQILLGLKNAVLG